MQQNANATGRELDTTEEIKAQLDREALKAAEEKVAKMSASESIDKEIARLDHFRSLNYHLEGTAMH